MVRFVLGDLARPNEWPLEVSRVDPVGADPVVQVKAPVRTLASALQCA